MAAPVTEIRVHGNDLAAGPGTFIFRASAYPPEARLRVKKRERAASPQTMLASRLDATRQKLREV